MYHHRSRIIATGILMLTLAPVSAYAQNYAVPPQECCALPPQTTPAYSPEQFDQLLAPIALYPDQLVSQILMASTYPLEVVEAYRWLQYPGNANLRGDDLAAALQQQPWDPSVKSLAAFPQVLKILNDNLQWTEQLGEAFLAQQSAVMDSIQRLRQRAAAANTLTSTPQQVVSTEGQYILIQPADPNIVYVPTYNPVYAYGAWPYASYPPYYFNDVYYTPGVVFGFTTGFAVIDLFWGWNHWDWDHHRIDIDDRRYAYLNHDRPPPSRGVWEHDPDHRRNVPYVNPEARQHFQHNDNADTRRSARGYAPRQNIPALNPYTAPRQPTVQQQGVPRVQTEEQRGQHEHTEYRQPNVQPLAPAMPTVQQRPSVPMFESYSHGADVRNQSARGSQSRASVPAPAQHAAPPVPQSHGGDNRGGDRHGGDRRGGGDDHGGHDNRGTNDFHR